MYTNELYHHGVKGMRWGVRKQRPMKGQRRVANTTSDRGKRIAKKVAIGAAIVGGTILASYGAYKLHNKAVTNLSKKYQERGSKLIKTALEERRLAAFDRNEADKAKLRVQKDLKKSLMDSAARYDSSSDVHYQRGMDYVNKGLSGDFSKKERLKEMGRIVNPRKNRSDRRYTVEQLRDMGIKTFEPETFEPERIKIDTIPVSRARIRRR